MKWFSIEINPPHAVPLFYGSLFAFAGIVAFIFGKFLIALILAIPAVFLVRTSIRMLIDAVDTLNKKGAGRD